MDFSLDNVPYSSFVVGNSRKSSGSSKPPRKRHVHLAPQTRPTRRLRPLQRMCQARAKKRKSTGAEDLPKPDPATDSEHDSSAEASERVGEPETKRACVAKGKAKDPEPKVDWIGINHALEHAVMTEIEKPELQDSRSP
jgi:hypothetical protein